MKTIKRQHYRGPKAKLILEHILEHKRDNQEFILNGVTGYYLDSLKSLYIAFDNRKGQCIVKEFPTQKQAQQFFNRESLRDTN